MYSISEVAKITKLTARALRHYEEVGLLKSTRNNDNSYRYYSKDMLTKIEEIKRYKKMDFSLEEIKSFVNSDENRLKATLLNKN